MDSKEVRKNEKEIVQVSVPVPRPNNSADGRSDGRLRRIQLERLDDGLSARGGSRGLTRILPVRLSGVSSLRMEIIEIAYMVCGRSICLLEKKSLSAGRSILKALINHSKFLLSCGLTPAERLNPILFDP